MTAERYPSNRILAMNWRRGITRLNQRGDNRSVKSDGPGACPTVDRPSLASQELSQSDVDRRSWGTALRIRCHDFVQLRPLLVSTVNSSGRKIASQCSPSAREIRHGTSVSMRPTATHVPQLARPCAVQHYPRRPGGLGYAAGAVAGADPERRRAQAGAFRGRWPVKSSCVSLRCVHTGCRLGDVRPSSARAGHEQITKCSPRCPRGVLRTARCAAPLGLDSDRDPTARGRGHM